MIIYTEKAAINMKEIDCIEWETKPKIAPIHLADNVTAYVNFRSGKKVVLQGGDAVQLRNEVEERNRYLETIVYPNLVD